MALENQIDFFKKRTEQIVQKVDRTPYYKLASLVIIAILVTTFSIGGVKYGINAYNTSNDHKAKAEQVEADLKKQQQEYILNNRKETMQAEKNAAYNNVKKISTSEYVKFMEYMKKQQNLYDSRVQLIIDSLISAQRLDRNHSLDGLREAERLQNTLANYKKTIENNIIQYNVIYNDIISGNENQKISDINNMMSIFNNFKTKTVIRNVELEKTLNAYLYVKNTGNVNYVLENNIITKMREFTEQAEAL